MGYVPCMRTIILASIQRQYRTQTSLHNQVRVCVCGGGMIGVLHKYKCSVFLNPIHSTWRHGAQTVLEGGHCVVLEKRFKLRISISITSIR